MGIVAVIGQQLATVSGNVDDIDRSLMAEYAQPVNQSVTSSGESDLDIFGGVV